MSAPEPMPCIADECRSPLACQHAGECRERAKTSAREYSEGLSACRELGITDPFKRTDYRRHNEENGRSFRQ